MLIHVDSIECILTLSKAFQVANPKETLRKMYDKLVIARRYVEFETTCQCLECMGELH